MYVITKRSLIIFMIIIFTAIGLIYFNNIHKAEATSNKVFRNVIVIDAGHGLPDGGASANGVTESGINIAIASKLNEALSDLGYEVIMTREDESNIADSDKQSPINTMKNSDLNNRVKIINNSNADICVSIHLNKYESSKYWGWQCFYSENSEDGKNLAEAIQSSIGDFVKRDNNRQALKISNIKIVDKTNIPVVIVECGFISNIEEANLLQDEEYQDKLVEGICAGIKKYYQLRNLGTEKETTLGQTCKLHVCPKVVSFSVPKLRSTIATRIYFSYLDKIS